MIRYRSIAAAAALLGASSALAADLPSRKMVVVAPPPSAACFEKNALPTDVFGFNTGSDVNDAGALSASLQYTGAYATRLGSFAGHTLQAQVSYGLLRCLEVGPYVIGSAVRNGLPAPFASLNGTTAGGGIEVKYKFLGRDVHGVGATLDVIVQGQGASGGFFRAAGTKSIYDTSVALFLDKELIDNKLYGAINISYANNWTDIAAPRAYLPTSTLRLGASLSYQVVDGFFFGAEVNHFRKYNSQFFGGELGNATFVGPTFYWQATKALAITGAYGYQVAGKANGIPGRLDLVNFNQHIAKFKIAYAF